MLRVAHIDASRSWYKRVLGCTEERRIARFGLYQMRLGDHLIDLVPVGSPIDKGGGGAPGKRRRNLQHFCVQLEAFDGKEIVTYLKRRGVAPGEVGRRYGAEGHGLSIYITDPDGNTVELKGPPDKDQSERVEGAVYPAPRKRAVAKAKVLKGRAKTGRSKT